jgi:hypothetical protein
VKHHTAPRFWKLYYALPDRVQKAADKAYDLLKESPTHSSLHFKKIGKFWSVRFGEGNRALGVETVDGDVVWFWLGDHDEYDRLIRQR